MINKQYLMENLSAKDLPNAVEKFLCELGYADWKCVLPPFLGPGVLGLCNYTTKTISVLNALVQRGHPDDIIETVLHEIAHVLAPTDGHGDEWKEKAKSIGLENPRIFSKQIENLPLEIQRIFYSHQLCVLSPDASIELLPEFTNHPRNLRNKFISGRPETRGRLRWKPL